MSTTFTASNGVEVEITENGCLGTGGSIGQTFVGPKALKALREFFQHERDQELGRWRDPVNRDLVVYRLPELDDEFGRTVQVMDETTGDTFFYWEELGRPSEDIRGRETADRYFEAHPEPKPWDEAKTGEVWELTDSNGRGQLWIWDEVDGWRSVHTNLLSSRVGKESTAGRRIWPEED